MPTMVHDLDLPEIDIFSLDDRDEARRALIAARERHWLARTPMGYMVLS